MLIQCGNYQVQIDESDLELISKYEWRVYAYGDKDLFYATASIVPTIYMHRLIMSAGKGTYVDHRDGNGLNNQRNNLRVTTQSVNIANARAFKNNTSGYRGVVPYRKAWKAQFKFHKRLFQSNEMNDKDQAAILRDEFVRQLMPNDSVFLNLPDIREQWAIDEAKRIISNQSRP